MALDAVFSDWLADGFGRKAVLVGMMVVYNTVIGLCVLAPDLTVLLVYHFFVGVGLDGQLPVTVSLVSKYVPSKVYGRFIVLLGSFWGLGWLSIALVFYSFILQTGWHSVLLFGALPLSYMPLMLKFIPESVPYLFSRGKTNKTYHLVSALGAQSGIMPPAEAVTASATPCERIHFFQLWRHPFARHILMLWLV